MLSLRRGFSLKDELNVKSSILQLWMSMLSIGTEFVTSALGSTTFLES